MDLNGVPCIIRDTAGVRSEKDLNLNVASDIDEVEKEGIRRARLVVVDLVLMIIHLMYLF